ncbi:MAG TPA: alpha-glucosidase C-terminal domain-containing protein, partial [Anaerolineaceae bacterium]
AFPWNREEWKPGLYEYMQMLISLLKKLPALRRGNYMRVFVDDNRGCYAFGRTLGDEKILVVLNASGTRRSLRLPVAALGWGDGHIVENLLGSGEYYVNGTTLSLAVDPWSGVWLK